MNKRYLPLILLSLIFTQAVFAQQKNPPTADKKHYFLNLFDKNADGIVTETEFNTVMQERYKTIDHDQNGIVSLDEFKKYSAKRHKKRQQKKNSEMDSNKDGLISKQEFIDQSIKRAEKKFNNLDQNQDGQLSQEENIDKHARKKQQL
ncbi:MAG: EF-hand domain-containing protein, partial [Methylococcales bacterium]|nr:EF-hand domain-containing protein [Methylococcales bacterium]